tara:strand:+ start:2850 stop:3767 length:918 start_codon:yes stop_codon:yes gene_type:complete
MPYIGNQAGNRFVASQAATRFSGNGSNKVFTLEHSVGSDEDILVSVDGVIQEPSISYVVSNGTTLTFQGSDAPSNGTNNIFVCYLFRTVATVTHPATSALSATTGTFSGAITGGGTFTPGGNIVIPDAGNIGSASDTDAMSISSGGVVTLSQSSQTAQTFRLAASEAGDGSAQRLTNYEEVDTDYTRVGAANWSESAGEFSSATTGTFLCMYNIVTTGGGDEFDARIRISTNSGSNYSTRAYAIMYTASNSLSMGNYFIFTVSNTSTFRLDFYCGAQNSISTNTTIVGDSNYTATGITFVKLGVI